MKLPPYDKFPEIISDTIVLRQIQIDDIKDIVKISFYDSRPAMTVEDATEMQDKINLDYQNGLSIHWGIADKNTNEIIGTLGYYRGFDKKVGELGCVLRPEFRGKGFMTEAMKLATEFGINDIGLTKIIAITTKQNNSATKLLERLNFIKIANLQDDEIEYQFVNNL
ncbi:GNAT family N-acetyltransferase [Flavobacterium sp. W1B]|uniref:GNAT family N-acetyltransferase n=1 Tax=Flavobacterium sp. W1B TaxID=3394146 RepID=UPI0039BCB83C